MGDRQTEVIVANKEGSEDFFQESEDKFRRFENNYSLLQAVIESVTDPLFVKDIHGRYVLINSIAASIAGKRIEEFIGRDDTEIYPPEIASQLMENDRQIMATGKPQILEEIATDGSTVKTYLSKKNVWRDAEGNIIGLVGLSQDITERKCHEAALKQQARILDQLCDSVITTDLNGIVTRWNKAAERLYGYSAAEAIGQLITFVYPLEQQDFFAQQILPVLQQHGVYPHPTPAIESEIEAIELEFLVEDLPKLLDSMKLGASRIREIVLSLRNFSRMDESQIKDVDIHEGIDSTLRLLQNRLKAKPDHPEIVVNKNYGKLPKIECYAGQLNQVFMNLLTNAIDALEERDKKRTPFDIKANPSTIQITTSVVAGGQKMAVSIADNGLGIPDSVKARIFDPFFTTKPIGKGTGLGLAISYQIVVEKHFGDLRCHSVPNRGTEFIMEIPIKQNSYRINT